MFMSSYEHELLGPGGREETCTYKPGGMIVSFGGLRPLRTEMTARRGKCGLSTLTSRPQCGAGINL